MVWYEDPGIFVSIVLAIIAAVVGFRRKAIAWPVAGLLIASVAYQIDNTLWLAWFGLMLVNAVAIVYAIKDLLLKG